MKLNKHFSTFNKVKSSQKKGHLIVLFILLISCTGYCQWQWQHPLPHGNTLFDVFFIDDNYGWVVGGNGMIQNTSNGGLKWIRQTSNANSNLWEVQFINNSVGWIVGNDGVILKTNDSGNNWLTINSISSKNIFGLFFYDENIGWICGDTGLIAHTIDGGLSFEIQFSESLNALHAIEFYDQNTGFCVGENGTVLKTTDGGENWINLNVPVQENINAFNCISADTIVCVGSDAMVLKTFDAGSNWIYSQIAGGSSIYSVCFQNNEGYATIDCGELAHTIDYGQNWESVSLPTNCWLMATYLLENRKCWITGLVGNILHYPGENGNWTRQQGVDYLSFTSLSFINGDEGWVVGEGGTVMTTKNGGLDWVNKNTGFTTWLEDVSFVDSKNGWTVGGACDGFVYRTVDGGDVWNLIVHSGYYLSAVFFIDESIGWIAGENGVIMHTINGGQTWAQQFITNNSYQLIYSIFFLDNNFGWICGRSGIMARTINGGEDWEMINPGISAGYFSAIHFTDQNEGWCVGGGFQGVLHTMDGGINWELQETDTDYWLGDVFFLNNNIGWACGFDALIYTTDGGNTWQQQLKITDGYLCGIKFYNEELGWACGSHTSIINTTNSGLVSCEKMGDYKNNIKVKNYPNPFVFSTTFVYLLEESTSVEILILKENGQLVDRIYLPFQSEGINKYEWYPDRNLSGFYFYTINSGKYSGSGKMLIIK